MIVWIVNARHVKAVVGRKTDKTDSAWLCKLLLAGLLRPSYIPPKQQRDLRDLTRYRKTLIGNIASNKNRIIRILEDCNIKLSSVLSDTQGAVGTKIVDRLLDGETITMEFIDYIYHGKLKASKEDIFEACEGFMTPNNLYLLQLIKSDISSIESLINSLDSRIKEMLSPYCNILDMLKKVHGISNKSAEDLVAEIGLDMNVFPSEKHLSLWVGIALGNNESAGKKSGRITHGNKQAKYVHLLKLLGQQLELKRLFTVQGIINWQAEEAKESLNRSRTLDPEICLQYIERRRRV